jgi:putative ABC transport system permease protein
MTSHLDRKLLRDLARMKGQAAAVAVVMACGLAMLVMSRSLIHSLETARQEYYQSHRFADAFAHLTRAPLDVARSLSQHPGIALVQPGIASQVTLDLAGLNEPASGMVRSLPDLRPPDLNRLFLRRGRWLDPARRDEVLVGEAFALANHLEPGDTLAMLLKGRRRTVRVAGIVLSPEYIFESRPGAALPDNRTYGIFWMREEEVAAAFDLDGAFNHLTVALAPGASLRAVLAHLDRALQPYGGRGAYARTDHPSHIRVSDEIRVLQTLSIGFPLVFLSVSAFMTHAVLSRLLNLQREQIAILKAFGFTNGAIGWHYLKFAIAMVAGGTVLGTLGGIFLGHRLVGMYHIFFRFPELGFELDPAAVATALGVGIAAACVGVAGAVRRATLLPPADAMRPEPPASFRPAILERTGIARLFNHSFRIAVRNLERRPGQAAFTVAGLTLATAILIIPNTFRDSVSDLLGFQWDVVQRQDINLGFVEVSPVGVLPPLRQLPGVLAVEPFRAAAVRLRYGHRSRQLGIQGIPAHGLHTRIVESGYREVPVPADGLVISRKLAEVLEARPGDLLTVEFLEGRRFTRVVPLVGLADDLTGITAYVQRRTLNRWLMEGDVVTGASLRVDAARQPQFLRALKDIPRVSWVALKESLRQNFRQTTAASINLIQSIYLTFATIVAFGVVYNNARISLAERARELATLRVIGFSQREVGAILVFELTLLALISVPLGLALGTGFARGILELVNTETVRLPALFTLHNYAFATATVAVASAISALLVLRRLAQIDLVSALRAPE